jgi:hypothetical protein
MLERVAEQLATWDCTALGKPFDLEEFLARVRSCLSDAPRPDPD